MSTPVAVVVITRDRRDELLSTIDRIVELRAAGDVDEVVVVDNASSDGSADAVRTRYPEVRLLPQTTNLGSAGRTVGVRATTAPLVAFADDDSWWEPGALPLAAQLFDRHPGLGLLHSRIVVHPGGEDDEVCARLASGPWQPDLPGPSIIGHLACGVVVRRAAYLGVGGYSPLLGFGGEERLMSLDLAIAGWAQAYVKDVVSHHQPSPVREAWPRRWARYRRNDTLTALLRLPAGWAARETAELLRQAATDPVVRAELGPFVRRVPRAVAQRRRLPEPVLAQLRTTLATDGARP